MPAEFFLDTNVLVYTFDSSAPAKRTRARELVQDALETGDGVISWQVAQEFLNVALHRFERPLTPREAAEYVDEVLAPLCADLVHREPAIRTGDPRAPDRESLRLKRATPARASTGSPRWRWPT
jgi:predicted nucleic acid-binding protein